MTIVIRILRLVVVVSHIVGVVQVDNLGRVLEYLVSLARNGEKQGRGQSSLLWELKYYLLRHLLVGTARVGTLLVSVLVRNCELVRLVDVILTGGLEVDLQRSIANHWESNYGKHLMRLDIRLR